jgi:hypothetical protein
MSTLSSFRVSYDPNTIPMLSLTCCNVKYDVIKLYIYSTSDGLYLIYNKGAWLLIKSTIKGRGY